MCCRVTIEGRGPNHNEILRMAGFSAGSGTGGDTPYEQNTRTRKLEDGTWLTLRESYDRSTLNIYPPVSQYEHHAGRREVAALMFKVGAFLAEDAKGKLVQEASVGMCLMERGVSSLTIAMYPQMPLVFDNICRGFREVFTSVSD